MSTRSRTWSRSPIPRTPRPTRHHRALCLTPDIFSILAETLPDSRGEIQLTNGLRALRGRRVIYAVEFEGKRHDTGEKLGFSRRRWSSPSRGRPGGLFRTYLKSLDL